MPLDPEILQQLMTTFDAEVNELLQIMTNRLLSLEKENIPEKERDGIILDVLRSAHNIKGTSASLDITSINQIAHHLESIFSSVQKKSIDISPSLIDLCLEATDKIKLAMESVLEKKPLNFDLAELIKKLTQASTTTASTSTSTEKVVAKETPKKRSSDKVIQPPVEDTNSTIRVPIRNIDHISVVMEEIQNTKIAIDNHYEDLVKLTRKSKEFSHAWKQIMLFVKNYINKNGGDGLQKSYLACSDIYTEITSSVFHMQKEMREQTNTLGLLFNALQDETRTLRLVPIANFLSTLPRYVRDLSTELNKKVELTITGDQVRIDKMVLDNLKDPIIHLIRNSIDHGIESPAERKNKNKSEIGHINLDISEDSGQIIIKITDDGSGIDLTKVAESAVSKNLIGKSEISNLNESQLSELIFLPGFSTKEMITDLSGRGVGLDIAKKNIENVGGQLLFKSEINKGTTFELRTPLTLSSERGFVVSVAGQLFVVPTKSVQRVALIPEQDILEIEGSHAVMLDNHPIQLHNLVDILELGQKELSKLKQLSILFIKYGNNCIAILVDEIIGEKEIVIKPLQAPLIKVPCVTGGTLSGNNQVIMVLDLRDLVHTAIHFTKTSHIPVVNETETAEIAANTRHILVVDDSITTRALEKNILESKNYKVTTAVNGKEAWELLQKESFSLVITDVSMPIMDGFSLTEQVKRSDKLHHLPVIIVTSLGSDAEKKRGVDVGADAYIIKNEFESGVLLEIVEQLL